MTKKTIGHVVSLGANCQTSMYLKTVGYKTFSGPFDWLAADDIRMLDDILMSDFKKFLDEEYLIDHTSGSDSQCAHSLYGSRFFHHFNPRHTWSNSYYKRCVERFRSLSACSKRVLCLLMVFYEPEEEMLKRIYKNLKMHVPEPALEFLVCIVASNSPSHSTHYMRMASSFAIWHLNVKSHTTGVAFASQEDNLYFHNTLHSYYDFKIAPSPFKDNMAYEKSIVHGITL